jgi:hypothetical protein
MGLYLRPRLPRGACHCAAGFTLLVNAQAEACTQSDVLLKKHVPRPPGQPPQRLREVRTHQEMYQACRNNTGIAVSTRQTATSTPAFGMK